jgi:hypothetical protein
MKSKFTIALFTGLGLPALLASAMAQQFGGAGSAPQPPATPPPSPRTTSAYVISDGKVEAVPVPVPPLPPAPPGAIMYSPYQRDSKTAYYTVGLSPASAEESNLAHQVDDLGRKLADSKDSEERSKIKSQLNDLLGKQFDLRQKRHQEEFDALKAKLEKLKQLLDKRQENRKDIIAKRLDQILSDAEGLGW